MLALLVILGVLAKYDRESDPRGSFETIVNLQHCLYRVRVGPNKLTCFRVTIGENYLL